MSENANAIKLAVGAVAIYIAAVTVDLRLLYYVAYVMLALLAAAFIWSQLNKRGLQVRRKVQPESAQVGQIIQELVEVENFASVPKLWLEVRDKSSLPGHHVGAVVSLGGRQVKRWRVRTRCTHRGLYHLGPTVVLTGDPFGLFHARRVINETADLLVYPPTVPLSSFGLPEGELPGGAQTQRRAHHTTPNAAGLREYMPGDPMNRIHWPVSARLQRLIVKEFELDPTADLWIVLDLQESEHVAAPEETPGKPVTVTHSTMEVDRPRRGQQRTEPETFQLHLDPSTEEYSVTIAASLAAYLISQGRSVGFIARGQHRVVIPADRGGRQLIKILRALAVLRAEGTSSLAEVLASEHRLFNRQDTLIVVTPSLSEGWLGALQAQRQRGIGAAAVLVEPGTFGGGGNALLVVGALSSMEVPTYVVKRDDTIDASLGQAYNAGAVRNMR